MIPDIPSDYPRVSGVSGIGDYPRSEFSRANSNDYRKGGEVGRDMDLGVPMTKLRAPSEKDLALAHAAGVGGGYQ